MTTKCATYINFKKLEGDDLDEDFKRFGIENKFDTEKDCQIFKTASITGHDAYIVTQ